MTLFATWIEFKVLSWDQLKFFIQELRTYYLQKYAFRMALLPYFFHLWCPSSGILVFLTTWSTTGRSRWYRTCTTSSWDSSPRANSLREHRLQWVTIVEDVIPATSRMYKPATKMIKILQMCTLSLYVSWSRTHQFWKERRVSYLSRFTGIGLRLDGRALTKSLQCLVIFPLELWFFSWRKWPRAAPIFIWLELDELWGSADALDTTAVIGCSFLLWWAAEMSMFKLAWSSHPAASVSNIPSADFNRWKFCPCVTGSKSEASMFNDSSRPARSSPAHSKSESAHLRAF
jgi:hypothetical protein